MQEETMAISGEEQSTSHDAGVIEGEVSPQKKGNVGAHSMRPPDTEQGREKRAKTGDPVATELRWGEEEQPSGRISAQSDDEAERGLRRRNRPYEESAETRARFRELIGGEYKQAFADEVQRIIDRRFRETKMLKQRVAELEGKTEKTDTVQVGRSGRQVAAPTGAAEQRDVCIDDAAPTGSTTDLGVGAAISRPSDTVQGRNDGRQVVAPTVAAEQRAVCDNDAAPTGAEVDLLYAILENDAADQQVRLTAERLKNDVDALRRKYPNLDPDTLLESDNAMRAYLSGASAEDLLWAMHHDRLLADAQSAVVESIRARQERPVENGASGGAAFTVRKDFSKMSLDELEAYGKH